MASIGTVAPQAAEQNIVLVVIVIIIIRPIIIIIIINVVVDVVGDVTHTVAVFVVFITVMPAPIIGWCINGCLHMTSVCRGLGPKSRTERPSE